jgi:hypothetical protein
MPVKVDSGSQLVPEKVVKREAAYDTLAYHFYNACCCLQIDSAAKLLHESEPQMLLPRREDELLYEGVPSKSKMARRFRV